jgi:hypothetical protein
LFLSLDVLSIEYIYMFYVEMQAGHSGGPRGLQVMGLQGEVMP